MKRRSVLSGSTPIRRALVCSVIVRGEQCQGPVEQERARTFRKKGKPMVCRAHENAAESGRIKAEAEATAQAYRDRVEARRHIAGVP